MVQTKGIFSFEIFGKIRKKKFKNVTETSYHHLSCIVIISKWVKKNHKIAVYSECPMSRFLRCALSRWQVVSGAYRHLSSRRASLFIHPSTHSHSMTSFFVKQWIRHDYVTDCIKALVPKWPY